MPEGIEVRIFAEQLHSKVNGHILQNINFIGRRYNNCFPKNGELFRSKLPAKIDSVVCKGKFIWFEFDNKWLLCNTLAMTGSWTLEKQKHSAVELQLDTFSLFFTDPRHFGTIRFDVKSNLDQYVPKGIDLLNNLLSGQKINKMVFRDILYKSKKTIAEVLMSQSIFCGIGNYIKAESLYRAKISPWRYCDKLSSVECFALYDAVCDVLMESYAAGGATLSTYKNFSGEGNFGKYLKVYGREFDSNNCIVKKETTLDKRTTWWVPQIQK